METLKITIPKNNNLPSSFWGMEGKTFEVRSTRTVNFSTGKQVYFMVEHNGQNVEFPERFLK